MASEESKSDVVREVRELLASGALLLPVRVEGWHKSLTDGGWFVRHSTGRTLATVEFVPVEIETGRPALDGNAPARAIVALLNSVPALCDEVEARRQEAVSLRQDNKTLGDGIKRYERETMKLREAAGVALRCLQGTGDKSIEQVKDQLRAALHPQPEDGK